jgi:hypothetical protein
MIIEQAVFDIGEVLFHDGEARRLFQLQRDGRSVSVIRGCSRFCERGRTWAWAQRSQMRRGLLADASREGGVAHADTGKDGI